MRIYADCHAGDALTSYSATLVSRRLPWMGRRDEPTEAEPEVHWAPAEAWATCTRRRRTRRVPRDGRPRLHGAEVRPRPAAASGTKISTRERSRRRNSSRQVALAEATVAAVAGRADVAFDLHWRYAPADALRLARALEHLPLLWLEDPTPPQDLASVARIAERTTTPICTGENLYRLDGFAALMDARRGRHPRARHPEGRRARGHRRIAALGDVHSRPLAPHNIAGPIGTLASAHVCASIPNFLALEWHAASVPFFDELSTLGRPVIVDGYVTLPDGPGIGAELDLEVARRYARPGEPFFAEPLA